MARVLAFEPMSWDGVVLLERLGVARNEDTLAHSHRMAQQLAAMRKLGDLPAVRERAIEVLTRLDEGWL